MDAAGLTYGRLILRDLCAFFCTFFLLFRALRVSPGDGSSVAALAEAALYLPSCTRDVADSHRRTRGLASEFFIIIRVIVVIAERCRCGINSVEHRL
jgi:hypothetical protein